MTTGPQNPYGAPPPYGPPYQPPYPGYQPPAPNHPSATAAMVLGIIGLVGLLSCAGVTLVLSPFAWAIGGRAVKEIDAAPPGTYSGRDQANAGRIMGLIGTILLIVAVLAVLAVVAALLVVSESSSSGY